MKKTWIALIVTLILTLACSAPPALASGNATIAVRGRDGFNDYISSMFVWGDKLLLSAYDTLYVWDAETTGLEKLENFHLLQIEMTQDEDGDSYALIGDEQIELDEGEGAYAMPNVYPAGDKLYGMVEINGEDGTEDVLLTELALGEDGFSIVSTLDLGDALIEDYGGYYSAYNLEQSCAMSGFLYGMTYGMDGRVIVSIDLETGDVDTMEFDTEYEIFAMSPFGDGKLLLSAYDYNDDSVGNVLLLYDAESEELSELGRIPSNNHIPAGVCYDEARAQLYYVMDGSVWRMPVGEEGLGEPEAFSDMPIDIYSDTSPVLMGDLYIVSSYDGIIGRDVTAEKMPDAHLMISDMAYGEAIRSAYFDFTAAHPEYAVSISSNGMESDKLIETMLSQSSDVDIYVMGTDVSAFSAIRDRGYMAELGGSEKLRAYVESVYPAFAEACSAEGELCAVPLSFYASIYGVNLTLLEKLGFTEADIPTSWAGLFALLEKLAGGVMEDFPEASLLMPGYTLDMTKNFFLNAMMEAYVLWLDADEAHLERGGDTLTALLEAFERVDWEAFGLPEESEDMVFEYNSENILFDQHSATPDQLQYMFQDDEVETRMMTLAIADGEEPLISAQTTVAFVNPFSTQRETAIEYLEMTAAQIPQRDRIALCPGENEPVENEYYAENIKSYDQMIADTEKALAEAEENEDDEMLEMQKQALEDLREGREWQEKYGRWAISAETIERYRAIAGQIHPLASSLWEDGEDSVYSQLSQYLDGAISAQQLAMELERSLQMKRLEDM